MSQFGYPFPKRKWDAILQGETTTAGQVSHNLPHIQMDNWKSFWQHLQACHGEHHASTTKNNSQIHAKYQLLGYLLKQEIGFYGRGGCQFFN